VANFSSFVFIFTSNLNHLQMKEPKAKKTEHILEKFNHKRVDPYFWMNERDGEDVLKYIDKENKFTKKFFKAQSETVDSLLTEFKNTIPENDESASFFINGLQFQVKIIEGKEYAITYQLDKDSSKLFFDQNERAEGHSFYQLADWSLSPSNELLAFSEDFVGRRQYQISFKDLKTNELLKDKIDVTDGNIVWANDNQTIFYIKKDPQTLREFQVYKHVLGTSTEKDELIFEELDERYYVSIGKTLTGKFIEIVCESSTTNETLLIDADNPSKQPTIFFSRKKGHIYHVEHHTNGFYILTNNKAKNNRILFSKSAPKSIETCSELIAHNSKVLIEDFSVFKTHLVTEVRENGLQKINSISLKDNSIQTIHFDEETYYVGLYVNETFATDKIYFSYNSLTTPSSVMEFSLKTGKQKVFFRKTILKNGFTPENYQSERIFALANDGTKIPVSLVYKKGIDLSKAPMMLYGYGSYGITIPDVFSPYRLSLLDRGLVYAIAHIRGEKYFGEKWYEDGKFLKKKNTFTDFINAAEFLIHSGKCHPNQIFAQGGSAGGLLMGAVTNMAPYLWKGIIAQVPFVDVLTTMLDETIPLTVGEYEEWGNPNQKDYYWYMLSYSPYDNVKKTNYPAMYITTGYHDSQVQYWEPLKWVAKIRDYRTNNNPLYFDCNLDAGHGGGSGRSTERLEKAKEFAFILSNLE